MNYGFARELLPEERLELGGFGDEPKPMIFPGLAITTFEGEIEADEKKASGQDDADLTVKGRKVRPVTVKLTWEAAYDAAAKEYLASLYSGPHAGKPREISHPDAGPYKVTKVVFLKVGKIERSPGSATCEISGKSASKPKGTTAGGGKGDGSSPAAKEAAKWTFTDPIVSKSPQPLGSTGNEVGGFAPQSADAPKAGVKK